MNRQPAPPPDSMMKRQSQSSSPKALPDTAMLAPALVATLFCAVFSISPASADSLKGGVKDSGQMSPSVTLTVPNASRPPLHSKIDIKQYAGPLPYQAGQPAPNLPPPRLPDPISNVPNHFHRGHIDGQWQPMHRHCWPRFGFPGFSGPGPGLQQPPPPPPRWDYTATPSNGIMTWASGYDTKVVTQYHPAYRHASASLFDTRAALANERLFGKPLTATRTAVARPRIPELRATPMVMIQKQTVKPVATWGEWYKRVASAVYEVWQQTSAGAGTAVVKVKVYPSRDVDCQIADFSPAQDLARDPKRESQFRQDALNAINALNRSAVWDFPTAANQTSSVVIDMELKHEVGSPAGCRVVKEAKS